MFFFLGILISKQIAPASLFSFPLRIKTTFRKKYHGWFCNLFYGSGMYRKHLNHTCGRNLKTSPSNQSIVAVCFLYSTASDTLYYISSSASTWILANFDEKKMILGFFKSAQSIILLEAYENMFSKTRNCSLKPY